MVELTTDLSGENLSVLDRLIVSIDLAEGFTLFFARCNVPALRSRLILIARQRLAALGVRMIEVTFTEEPTNVRERLRTALLAADEADEASLPIAPLPERQLLGVAEAQASYAAGAKRAVFVVGLEYGIPYDQPNSRVLAELNLGRDLFPRDAPCPLVFWLPDYALTAIARHAPDFWAWRSGVFEFSAAEEERSAAVTQIVHEGPDEATLWNLARQAKLLRRRQLESLLDDYRDAPQDDRTARERAAILSDLGDVCFAMRDYGAAETYLNQALPAFERLGDVRERAVTLGKIADVLQARGQLDEALRIRQEEQLPVYERLGDVRERAVTLGKIADVLQARGQLDEALRILQEEALPAFERLGVQRDILVAQANIALLLLQRDAPGDRAEAIHLLNLALDAARRMRLPEAAQVEAILAQIRPAA